MSYQFKLVSLSGPGVVLNHDGKPYVNPDTVEGVSLGVDTKGHLYFSDRMAFIDFKDLQTIYATKPGKTITILTDALVKVRQTWLSYLNLSKALGRAK